MRRGKLISGLTFLVGIMMISVGLYIQNDTSSSEVLNTTNIQEFNIKNMAASAKGVLDSGKVEKTDDNKEVEEVNEDVLLTEVQMETAPASVMRIEVYEGMTVEELAEKINHSLGGILAGHGDIIASHSIEIGVDPYIVTAIMMHETGNGTSNIANNCYNFGGQKGAGCGAYKRYDTVEAGLVGIMDNLYKNYYAYGLTTVEAIGGRYAESSEWPAKINWYIGKIRAA